jgi:hypothetical protein
MEQQNHKHNKEVLEQRGLAKRVEQVEQEEWNSKIMCDREVFEQRDQTRRMEHVEQKE